MKEGFLIGGSLIIAGLMLELSAGPVNWDAFRWPVNGIVLAGFLALIAIIFLLRNRVVWLSVYWHLQGCDTCTGLCCYTDDYHGTDTTEESQPRSLSNGRGEFMDQLHAEFLALRTYLRIYRRDSWIDCPSAA